MKKVFIQLPCKVFCRNIPKVQLMNTISNVLVLFFSLTLKTRYNVTTNKTKSKLNNGRELGSSRIEKN